MWREDLTGITAHHLLIVYNALFTQYLAHYSDCGMHSSMLNPTRSCYTWRNWSSYIGKVNDNTVTISL